MFKLKIILLKVIGGLSIMRLYKIGEFAEMTGFSTHSLRNWDKNGKLKPAEIINGKRYYSEEQYHKLVGTSVVQKTKKIIGYARVSSSKQKDDLERQIENIKTYMYAKGYQFEMITDIGSGINYSKKGLKSLIKLVETNEVEKIVILYKDRLLRFGYELLEYICELHDVQIEIIDNTEKTEQEELVEDLVQIITVFSCKLQGKRVKRTRELMNALKAGD